MQSLHSQKEGKISKKKKPSLQTKFISKRKESIKSQNIRFSLNDEKKNYSWKPQIDKNMQMLKAYGIKGLKKLNLGKNYDAKHLSLYIYS